MQIRRKFLWHFHENEDELFLVLKGVLFIDFRHQETVEVKEGEIVIVLLKELNTDQEQMRCCV